MHTDVHFIVPSKQKFKSRSGSGLTEIGEPTHTQIGKTNTFHETWEQYIFHKLNVLQQRTTVVGSVGFMRISLAVLYAA